LKRVSEILRKAAADIEQAWSGEGASQRGPGSGAEQAS
jgi:hypothetical protein